MDVEEEAEAGPSRPRKRYRPRKVEEQDHLIQAEPGVHWYIQDLNNHVDHTRNRAVGAAQAIQDDRHDEFRGRITLLPPNNVEFTPLDKRLFFLSLSRHSRFRSDLIAADINRSEAVVEGYLDLLEDGLDYQDNEETLVASKKSGVGKLKGSHWWKGGLAPAAREVSLEWLDKEAHLRDQVESLSASREQAKFKHDKQVARRSERRALTRRQKQAYGQGHLYERSSELSEMKQRWKAQDWGEDLDFAKLRELGDCSKASPSAQDDLLESNDEITATASIPLDVSPSSDSCSREQETIDQLESIPRKQRTKEQISQRRNLLKRLRERRRQRIKSLLASGMTQAQMDEQGASLTILDRKIDRKGRSWNPIVQETTTKDKSLGLQPKNLDEPGYRGKDDDPARDARGYMEARGWDLFDPSGVALVIKKLFDAHDPNAEALTATSSLSFVVLEMLYADLKAYLAPLILRCILMAEQGTEQGSDKDKLEMTEEHINWALAARNERPQSVLADFQKRYGVITFPLGSTSSSAATPLDNSVDDEQEADRFPLRDLAVIYPLSMVDEENDSTSGHSDGSSNVTDEEDEQLEDARDAMDTAYDEVLEQRLWKCSRHGGETGPFNDPWSKRLKKLVPEGLANATDQRKKYEQILNEISKSRRWRRALAQRSVKMPTTRLWRQGQGLRMHKSKSIVIDSDSEMEWLEDEEDEILEEREEGAFDLDADERNLYSENSSSSEGRASDADDLESEEW